MKIPIYSPVMSHYRYYGPMSLQEEKIVAAVVLIIFIALGSLCLAVWADVENRELWLLVGKIGMVGSIGFLIGSLVLISLYTIFFK